jgi:hypothetical protein
MGQRSDRSSRIFVLLLYLHQIFGTRRKCKALKKHPYQQKKRPIGSKGHFAPNTNERSHYTLLRNKSQNHFLFLLTDY